MEDKKIGPGEGEEIEDLRRRVDELDRRIVRLLSERGELCKAIGRSKRNLELNLHDPAREEEVHRNISGCNRGPYPDETLRAIYREIMRASLELERREEEEPPQQGSTG